MYLNLQHLSQFKNIGLKSQSHRYKTAESKITEKQKQLTYKWFK